MDALIKNTVLKTLHTDELQRVLYVSSEKDCLVTIALGGRRRSPSIQKYSEWMSMLIDGTLELIEDPNLHHANPGAPAGRSPPSGR